MSARNTPEFADERRRYTRWSLPLAVRVIRPDVHVMRAANISAGGGYCPDAAPRRPGETVLLEIDLAPRQVFVAAAKVVRHKGSSGVRLEFTSTQNRRDTVTRRLLVG